MARYSPPLAWWYLKKQRQRRAAEPVPPPFDPSILFANGEQGAWYDPSDLTTLFQNRGGTTPVTTSGDPVGLVLDKRLWGGETLAQVLAGQAERLPGGDFSTSSGWTLSAQSTISGGVARVQSSDGSYQYIARAFGVTAGRAYFVEVDIISQAAGSLRVSGTSISSGTFPAGTGRKGVIVIASATSAGMGLNFDRAGGVTDITFDNASVKEIPGNHLTQPTAAARPTLLDVSGNLGLRFDLADDALTTVLPQAINGDILIAGTGGTIIEPVSYADGSTFALGPDTYTGGASGVLAAVGDIVAVLLIDKTLTQLDRDNLVAYYQAKGAGGLL